MEPGRETQIVPGLLSLRLVANEGAAFGALSAWPALLILISLTAVIAILVLRKERAKSIALAIALGLLLGGAAGNLADRIIFGYVTDFLDVGISVAGRLFTWPTFNLADVSITLGVVFLVYHVLRAERQPVGEETGAGIRNNK